jgi:glycine cleavage system transcriptional repressor
MMTIGVLTAVGKDQPGIVTAVSQILYETGCNIEDSSMTILRGDFAMILIISVPKDLNLEDLDKKLNPLRQSVNLTMVLHKLTGKELSHKTASGTQMYIISVYGTDKPGIVYKVTRLLASESINICDLNTKITGDTKNPVYIMVLEVEIPPSGNIDDLKQKLAMLQEELKVEINLKPLEIAEL